MTPIRHSGAAGRGVLIARGTARLFPRGGSRNSKSRCWIPAFAGATVFRLRREGATKGQATTEVVLLLPLFMFFLYAFAKIFAVLVLIQKMEIASYYAARRWQLESHRNIAYESSDMGALKSDILKYVNGYLGVGNPIGGPMYQTTTASFLGIQGAAQLDIKRTQVWQVVTLTVNTQLINTPLFKFPSKTFEVTKYVPNRDRPIAFVLPGLKQ